MTEPLAFWTSFKKGRVAGGNRPPQPSADVRYRRPFLKWNATKIIFGGGILPERMLKMISERRAAEMIKDKNTPAEYLKFMAQSAEACLSTYSRELWDRYFEASAKGLFSGASARDILDWAYGDALMKPVNAVASAAHGF